MIADLSYIFDDRTFDCFVSAYEKLLAEMDAAYAEVAANYQFCCNGCEDNCCLSTFHHHTLLEYIHLSRGLSGLSNNVQNLLLKRAKRAVAGGQGKKRMCPVNEDERCLLYFYRPMICRLHGIPYTLAGPGPSKAGNGCHIFENKNSNRVTDRLNRTPIYQNMALLEKKLRRRVSFDGRIHLTVAQMILCFRSNTAGFSPNIQTKSVTGRSR